MPTAAAPSSDLLLAAAELLLNQRSTEHGGWQSLTPDEFKARQRALVEFGWRVGPPPQVRLYR
jgi:hypothetical protein